MPITSGALEVMGTNSVLPERRLDPGQVGTHAAVDETEDWLQVMGTLPHLQGV